MKSKINISIDDVSPHPQSGVGVLERCYELIKVFPTIKFTLFIPLCYMRFNQRAYPISEFPEFCEIIKKLSPEHFEIGYHGFHHGIPNVSSNDEFMKLDYNQAKDKFNMIMSEADKSGITFKKIFRPPAWKMSSCAIKRARDIGMDILALSPYDTDDMKFYNHINSPKHTYGGEDEKFKKVVYYNVNPPFLPLKLYPKTEMVYHACEWDKNYLSINMMNDLKQFLLLLNNDIEFTFMDGVL